MGRKRKEYKVVIVKEEGDVPISTSASKKYWSTFKFSLKEHCGCCNKKFSKELRKTKKFMVNTSGRAGDDEIVDISQGMEDMLIWKHGKQFNGTVDKDMAFCSTCGIITAKLYTTMKLFENAKAEFSYLTNLVENTLSKESKATDTTEDVAEEEALAAAAVTVNDVSYDSDPVGDAEIPVLSIPDFDLHARPGRTTASRMRDNSNKEFLCQYCPAGFNKNANLTRHLLLSHEVGNREKEFRCSVCGKEYYFGYLLKNHERFHAEQRPFTCSMTNCNGAFKSKLGLRAHIQTYHRENRPFKCRFCPKDFKDKRNHRIHEAYVHTISRGVKPWTCQFCGMKYRRKSTLSMHRRKGCPSSIVKICLDENEAAVKSIVQGEEMEVAGEIIV